MGNDELSSKQVGSQASRRVTRRLAWIQPVCISINVVPALKGLSTKTVVAFASGICRVFENVIENGAFVFGREGNTWLGLILILFFICCGCPSSWDRQQAAKNLIPDLQAVLFCGSVPPKLQAFMSAITQSDHVFLGLPRALEHGNSILVTDLIQDEDLTKCSITNTIYKIMGIGMYTSTKFIFK